MKPNLKALIDAACEAYLETRKSQSYIGGALSQGYSFAKSFFMSDESVFHKSTDLQSLKNKTYSGTEDQQFDEISKDIEEVLFKNPYKDQGFNFKTIINVLQLAVKATVDSERNKSKESITALIKTLSTDAAQKKLSEATEIYFAELEKFQQNDEKKALDEKSNGHANTANGHKLKSHSSDERKLATPQSSPTLSSSPYSLHNLNHMKKSKKPKDQQSKNQIHIGKLEKNKFR